MPIGLLGRKLGMTRIFDERGTVIPVTIIEAGPCPILQIKNKDRDGYSALQVGFDPIPERKANRPMAGHFKASGVTPVRVIREFRTDQLDGFEPGQSLDLSLFEIGEKIDVVGRSKGRGFTGPIKRHNSSRGPESHGSRYHRRTGSIGAAADPSHVFKGKPMAGQYGAGRVTAQNLKILELDKEKNLIVVQGSIPGANNGYVMICKSKKAERKAARKG